jgi:hypothetical protein
MDNVRRTIVFLVAACGLMSCDNSFNPDGPYQRKLVVYAVLSDRSDTQYVRVYGNYPPASSPAYAPADNQVTDAIVTVARGTTLYQFHDTTVPRADLSRYTAPILVYVAYGFPSVQAARHRLTVTSPTWGTVSASIVSLYRGQMFIQNTGSLIHPTPSSEFSVTVTPGLNVAAYIVRAFLSYEIYGAGQSSSGRMEVPIGLHPGASGPDAFIYPTPIPRGSAAIPESPGDEIVVFSSEAARSALDNLQAQYPGDTIRFRDAVIQLTQVDSVLYSYYSVLHGFPGSGTIRLDEPDFSNIIGGLGLFASTTVDSMVLPISSPSSAPSTVRRSLPPESLNRRKE